MRLLDREYKTISAVDLFKINRELHETIVDWAGNRFFLDAFRRLIEYSKVLETRKIGAFTAEQFKILNTIAKGDMAKAERRMLRHLQPARKIMTYSCFFSPTWLAT